MWQIAVNMTFMFGFWYVSNMRNGWSCPSYYFCHLANSLDNVWIPWKHVRKQLHHEIPFRSLRQFGTTCYHIRSYHIILWVSIWTNTYLLEFYPTTCSFHSKQLSILSPASRLSSNPQIPILRNLPSGRLWMWTNNLTHQRDARSTGQGTKEGLSVQTTSRQLLGTPRGSEA